MHACGVFEVNSVNSDTNILSADNILQVAINTRGKPDVTGKLFHDEILAGALKNGTGWVEYVYINPVQTNLYYKTTYYRLTKGSDGKSDIAASDNFRHCNS